MSSKDGWDLENALKVLQHPTVDAQTWAEAVEWLLRYGPDSIKKILLEASTTATEMQFPEIQPAYYTEDGQAVYDAEGIAEILGISVEQANEIINRKVDPANSLSNLDLYTDGSKTIH